MRLSIALATYNEQNTIGKCIKSVGAIASEIVMVDGSSTDDTVKIAKKLGANVIITDNPAIFHVNKQKAVDACRGDWVLQLDADEIVSEQLANEILSAVKQSRPKADHPLDEINGYWIPRKNYFLGRWLSKGGQYPDYTLRLYRRGKGKLPCKSVHEQAIVEGKTDYFISPLLHFPYPDFKHYLEHFNRYTSILSGELKEQNVTISLINSINYLIIKPKLWFIKSYLRHRGYVDGFAGFAFSLWSALRFPASYIKYWVSLKSNK